MTELIKECVLFNHGCHAGVSRCHYNMPPLSFPLAETRSIEQWTSCWLTNSLYYPGPCLSENMKHTNDSLSVKAYQCFSDPGNTASLLQELQSRKLNTEDSATGFLWPLSGRDNYTRVSESKRANLALRREGRRERDVRDTQRQQNGFVK